jgi:hypothetical protein
MTDKTQKEKLESYDPESCPFSWDKFDGLLAYKSSLVVCADILDVSESTIKNHIKQRYGMSFSEYAEKKLSRTKVKLVQKAIEMATSGNSTMMIFCLKNLCKWSDNNDQQVEIGKIQITLPDQKLNDV